jgi:3-oxoacyl-[acyl-carrier protein] reductase
MSTDRYASLVRTDLGGRLAEALGAPRPAALRRHERGAPPVVGPALVTGAPGGTLRDLAVDLLLAAGVEVHEEPSGDAVDYGAVVHDASATSDAADLGGLYRAVQAGVRRLGDSARVVVLGADPAGLDDPRHATAQRALVGFTKSVGKELGGGSTANLVLVTPGAEAGAVAPLRFLLSARSAYVSGQVVTVGPATDVAPVPPTDPERPLDGRVAVVTGAAGGIGTAIARVLARDGAQVVCVDLPVTGERLVAVANEVGGTAVHLDITDAHAPSSLATNLRDRHGGVDVVVNNAGITRDKTLRGMTDDRWDAVLGVNLVAVERLDEHLVATGTLRDGGRIVCMSSAVGGIAGNRGQTNYGASKAGVIGHVEALAGRLAPTGGTANAVAPGFIETEMTDRMPLGPREVGRRLNALGQGGLPVDVAEAVALFAGPDATWLTGRTLRVCGLSWLGA